MKLLNLKLISMKALALAGVVAFVLSSTPSVSADLKQPIHCVGFALESASEGTLPLQLTKAEYVRRYVERHHSIITDADNQKFIGHIKEAPIEGKIFFVAQNPILKEMNDILFKDKSVATAVTNQLKETLLTSVYSESKTKNSAARYVESRYANYKSVELMLKDTPEAQRALDLAYRNATHEFDNIAKTMQLEDTAGELKTLKQMVNERRGIAGDPSAWLLAGTGKTPDEADLASRFARLIASMFRDGKPKIQDFERIAPKLVEYADKTEHYRRILQAEIPEKSGIMIRSERFPDQMVLSPQAVELLRKMKVSTRDYTVANEMLQKAFADVFGVKLRPSALSVMTDYFFFVDLFSPGIYPVTHSGFSLPTGRHGALGIDFVGLGAKNLVAVMDAMIPHSSEISLGAVGRVREVIKRTRQGVDRVSVKLDRQKDEFGKIVGKVKFSGDDGIHYPIDEFQPESMLDVMEKWSAAGAPADGRFSYVTPTYQNGKVIRDIDEDRLRSAAEALEKEIRQRALNRTNIEKMRNLAIGVYYTPAGEAGGGTFKLVVAGPAAKDWALIKQVNESFASAVAEKNGKGVVYEAIGLVRPRDFKAE